MKKYFENSRQVKFNLFCYSTRCLMTVMKISINFKLLSFLASPFSDTLFPPVFPSSGCFKARRAYKECYWGTF